MKSHDVYVPNADTDPALTRFVTASTEEIQFAQELRRLIEQRYLGRSKRPDPYWCVAAD